MSERYARPVALALVFRGGQILVEEGRDSVKDESFSRLLGGTIEFGERGEQAVRRELREELGAEIDVVGLAGTIENLFTYEGRAEHELVLVYECTLRDAALYDRDSWIAHEPATGVTHGVAWKDLDRFRPAGDDILHPAEVLAFAHRLRAAGSRTPAPSFSPEE